MLKDSKALEAVSIDGADFTKSYKTMQDVICDCKKRAKTIP